MQIIIEILYEVYCRSRMEHTVERPEDLYENKDKLLASLNKNQRDLFFDYETCNVARFLKY